MEVQVLRAGKNISINCQQVVYNDYDRGTNFTLWLGWDYSSIPKELDSKFNIKYSEQLNEYYIELETKFISIRRT